MTTLAPLVVGTKRRRVPVVDFKVLDGKLGLFSAVVSVFDNTDYDNERVRPGFFSKSLTQLAATGDPVPVIFSHRWDDLNAHVGITDPSTLREAMPGDPALPEKLKPLGGLLVPTGQLDIDEPGPVGDQARALFKRLERRSIKQWSFAFETKEWAPADDGSGAIDLLEGDLIELGPCLVGANPETDTISTRSRIVAYTPTIDALLAKAGRVLSAANEQQLLQARDLIEGVLSSVGVDPEAGEPDDQVAKAADLESEAEKARQDTKTRDTVRRQTGAFLTSVALDL